ncbi:ATP-binding protein [Mesobacillus subterraneus]|uniref:ATP-binding protein n=1 Tax=Mesobacillus subterraneus TaxID=285983 RepID=A0A3R9F3E5_9BACI|nr:ATP-binding protein [Mesobacillus subterraneus]RSD29000.1 ATP-binding protein [Mesobacillus subterraneus]
MMKPKDFILSFKEMDATLVPNYYEYGYLIHQIKEELFDRFGVTFQQFSDDETTNEIWEVLEEDVVSNNEKVQFVSYILDVIETATISSTHTEKVMELIAKPRINNSVFYYPEFKVALARVPIFQNHMDTTYDLLLCENQASLEKYLQYILKRKRDYIRNYVTVYTDTDDGVDTSKERITNLVNRDEVFLEETTKKEIYRSIDEFFSESKEFFTTYKIPYKRGILLYGKPGNGKTTLVKSIANSISAPVAYWQITEYTSSYSIKEVFSSVSRMAPMVLVIEDIDSMPEHVRSYFLNTLDGATSKEGIFLIGTTNYPEKIDPALINRAGRFDRAYELKLPSKDMRTHYLLKKNIQQFITSSELDRVIQLSNGFSFAQLNELYTAVALQYHYDQAVDIEHICSELQSANKKSKKQEWNSEQDNQRVGFGM